MKVFMTPMPSDEVSGINTVARSYLSIEGVEFVASVDECDVEVVHAGVTNFSGRKPSVAINHGLYWTGMQKMSAGYRAANVRVVQSMIDADVVTVPSQWVRRAIRQQMGLDPIVLPHMIDTSVWHVAPARENDPYSIGYGKNRIDYDCEPDAAIAVARAYPNNIFVTTHDILAMPENLMSVGVVDEERWRRIVQSSMVVLSAARETFGMIILEAIASGKPVLSYNYGNARVLIDHKVNGYLATDEEDFVGGFSWCLENYDAMPDPVEKLAPYSPEFVGQKFVEVLQMAVDKRNRRGVSFLMPAYNSAETIGAAIESIQQQKATDVEIIVVDNNSLDDTADIAEKMGAKVIRLSENVGAAEGRNIAAKHATGRYLATLDSDDMIKPGWLNKCLMGLASDPAIYIAYTKLSILAQDERPSPWPGAWNHRLAMEGKNQVPSAALMRREVYERTGGWRTHYCEGGAGSEDADFWLRAGNMGMGATLASDEHLYVYRLGGHTSERDYVEPDWFQDKWYFGTKYKPVACLSDVGEPVAFHADTPDVSVIIPVGAGHEKNVWRALTTMENQTYRNMEVVVAWDSPDEDALRDTAFKFKFPRYVKTDKPGSGPGRARNVGADASMGKIFIFFDADDYADKTMVEKLVTASAKSGAAVYSDYYGITYMDEADIDKVADKIISYDKKLRKLTVLGRTSQFNRARAMEQPRSPLYIWCNICTAIPRDAHYAVGGFDEGLRSWEDWLYWLKMVRTGISFIKLNEPLFYYDFTAGKRRELGIKIHTELIDEIKSKLSEVDVMACCGQGGTRLARLDSADLSDGNMVLVELVSGGSAPSPIYGRDRSKNTRHFYGNRRKGERFLIRRQDADGRFKIVERAQASSSEAQPKPPSVEIEEFDVEVVTFAPVTPLTDVAGIGPKLSEKLESVGIRSVEDLIKKNRDYLYGVGLPKKVLDEVDKLRWS